MSDVLDATARQVRMYGRGDVHRLSRAWTSRAGREYRTGCGLTWQGSVAVLTTRRPTCRDCGGDR